MSRDNYELMALIGKGQWGRVFLARPHTVAAPIQEDQEEEEEVVALKEIRLQPNNNVDHLRNELLVMTLLPPHPFIIRMHEAFRSNKHLYLAMEFAAGGDMFTHWRAYKDRRLEMAPLYCAEVLLALEHLHLHGILYRDLKPENVLLDAEGHVKLADMGLAKILPGESARTTSFCGTEAYLPPEMLKRMPYGPSIDFWQYGCFVFEMYAGRSPFWAPKAGRKDLRASILKGQFQFPKSVPTYVRPLITGLLQVDVHKRLGCGSDGWIPVKQDSFFSKCDWEVVMDREAVPAILPKDCSQDLAINFDKDFVCQAADFGNEQDQMQPAMAELQLSILRQR